MNLQWLWLPVLNMYSIRQIPSMDDGKGVHEVSNLAGESYWKLMANTGDSSRLLLPSDYTMLHLMVS